MQLVRACQAWKSQALIQDTKIIVLTLRTIALTNSRTPAWSNSSNNLATSTTKRPIQGLIKHLMEGRTTFRITTILLRDTRRHLLDSKITHRAKGTFKAMGLSSRCLVNRIWIRNILATRLTRHQTNLKALGWWLLRWCRICRASLEIRSCKTLNFWVVRILI